MQCVRANWQCQMCRVRVLCPTIDPDTVDDAGTAMAVLEDYGVEPVGFLQFFNSWKEHAAIRKFLNESGIAEAAAELLGCKKVRLYQVTTVLQPFYP